jgi:hypothetical protein
MPLWQTVLTAVFTLVGTVSGTVLGSVLKSRADSTRRVHDWQVAVVEIYGNLMTALSNHRVAMWDLEAARIRNHPVEMGTTLAASLVTRAEVTKPHAQLVVLAPQLKPVVDGAVRAVYAMDTATADPASRTDERLTASRQAAKTAMNDLVAETASVLTALGAGLPTR